jgi:signal transduction histidine kinase/HPt (histidine-containing phosphotransfer) domain-containing protein
LGVRAEGARPVADASVEEPSQARKSALLYGRVAILFRLAHFNLSFPFAALCMASALIADSDSIPVVALPVVLYIAATAYGGRLQRAYERRGTREDPRLWARRYVVFSAVAGAIWGLGALLWFNSGSFASQAYLVLAFLGMSTTEFVPRAAYRPAYLAHAIPAVTPLAVLLALEGGLYQTLCALLLIFVCGVLYTYAESLGALFERSILLQHDNARLIIQLNEEKRTAEKMRDHAQAGERAKSAFISNASHELRTPLHAILGMAQLLERSELEKAQRDHVKVMLEAGRGLKTLLDDIIALANNADEAMHPPEEGCDAAQAARTVARLLQPNAWEKRLRLSVNIAHGLPRVACDPRLLRRVLLKVAGNAIKFTERGNIEIALDETKDPEGRQIVRFGVTDTGPGIPADLLSTIFEPFTKSSGAEGSRSAGAGVGLSVAKRLVESAGGSIGVESEPGMGARFWITLPVARAEVMASAAQTADSVSPPTALTLLVLARDPAIRTALKEMLIPHGNRINFADSLGHASTIAARSRFDLIVSTASHADSLAATPSQRTPILALAQWDERPPLGAALVLRWPATADALYSAIGTVLGDGPAMSSSTTEEEVEEAVDAKTIAELEKSLGLKTLLDILQSFMQSAEQLAAAIAAASERSDWTQASRLAQDFAGAAGGLGLTGISAAARVLAQHAREGAADEELNKATRDIIAAHHLVAEALRRRYPDLSPASADAA